MPKYLKFFVWTAIVVGGIIGVARLTAIRWWQVPDNDPLISGSISPTLGPGDWVLLWRLTEPGYGDLVVCPDPTHPDDFVIARIAAEANDTIKIQGENIWINGSPVRTESACTERTFQGLNPTTGNEVEQYCDKEDMGGHVHMRGNISTQRRQSGLLITEQKVGPGMVFLVSDNRLFPFDSRTFGQVDRKTCKETVFFRLVGPAGFFDVKRRLTFIH